ncbi:mechanosensitive ion channel [Erythrobacter sp. T5W1-R]|uniref:mechanosensitive ion channel family protein n=1 Tax=Erythrobacter sp. T5W1-R TaxID=3101752 RepID=UPI002AFFFC34|nr:mechanosensitive ion channel domain-containing protein [Erythrobacter sp. T5W1-R]MEA1618521.1 mechanosensitive ion channel [Erythrobacter sp. T5W1-R]
MIDPTTALNQLSQDLNFAGQAWLWLRANLIELSGAFAVTVIGFFVVRTLGRAADKALNRSERIEPTVAKFLGNVVKYALWVILGVTVLTQFGVQTTTIIAALGGLALAVGLALQGTLSNVAAGVMILLQRPFRVGEYITCGTVAGTVQAIGLFTTEITQLDGLYVMVPNNELWNKPIVNFSRQPTRRFELVIGIGYADSIAQARSELLALAHADPRVLDDPEPVVFVAALAESAVNIGLRVWCATPDYLRVSWELTEAAKNRFAEVGISIPFPQREVRTIPAPPQ